MTRPLLWLGGLCLISLTLVFSGLRQNGPLSQSLVYAIPNPDGVRLHIDNRSYQLLVDSHRLWGMAAPVASDDGAWLAFALAGDVYKVRRNGTGLQHLATLHPSDYYRVYGLAWSADGNLILATLASPVFGKALPPYRATSLEQAARVDDGVFIIKADGSGYQLVTELPYTWFTAAVWTPNNEWVIYCDLAGVHRIRPDGSQRLTLYAAEWFQTYTPLAFLAEGDWVVATDASQPQSPMLLIRSDGSGMTLPAIHQVETLVGTPDGRRLAYIADNRLWLYDGQQAPYPIFSYIGYDVRDLVWSPNQREVMWTEYVPASGDYTLYQVAVVGPTALGGEASITPHMPYSVGWVPSLYEADWHALGLAMLGIGLIVGGLKWSRGDKR